MIHSDQFFRHSDVNMGEEHAKHAKSIRSNAYYQNLIPLPIQNEDMFPDAKDHPITFEEVYVKEKSEFDALESL